MSGDVVVSCEGLEKVFGGGRSKAPVVRAVDALSFEARAGEVYGLLGPNGAGKTTTLRMLATILRPTGGDAQVAGHSVVGAPMEVRRRLGFLSCNTGLYARLTPRELVRYFGRLYEVPAKVLEGRIDEMFARFGIDAFADRMCEKLSSGQQQKVNLARTVIHDPPVLILDEPTANLDPLAAREVVELIRERREGGTCVIFSTHQLYDAERLCDRLGIIIEGQLLASGSLEEICKETKTDGLEAAFFALAEVAETKEEA